MEIERESAMGVTGGMKYIEGNLLSLLFDFTK